MNLESVFSDGPRSPQVLGVQPVASSRVTRRRRSIRSCSALMIWSISGTQPPQAFPAVQARTTYLRKGRPIGALSHCIEHTIVKMKFNIIFILAAFQRASPRSLE
jgi:hypothetical protein